MARKRPRNPKSQRAQNHKRIIQQRDQKREQRDARRKGSDAYDQ